MEEFKLVKGDSDEDPCAIHVINDVDLTISFQPSMLRYVSI